MFCHNVRSLKSPSGPATSPENEEEPAVETPEKPNADERSGGMEINPETGKDKYNTDPVPEAAIAGVNPLNHIAVLQLIARAAIVGKPTAGAGGRRYSAGPDRDLLRG